MENTNINLIRFYTFSTDRITLKRVYAITLLNPLHIISVTEVRNNNDHYTSIGYRGGMVSYIYTVEPIDSVLNRVNNGIVEPLDD